MGLHGGRSSPRGGGGRRERVVLDWGRILAGRVGLPRGGAEQCLYQQNGDNHKKPVLDQRIDHDAPPLRGRSALTFSPKSSGRPAYRRFDPSWTVFLLFAA